MTGLGMKASDRVRMLDDARRAFGDKSEEEIWNQWWEDQKPVYDEMRRNEQDFPCAVCGKEPADWDEKNDELRCSDHLHKENDERTSGDESCSCNSCRCS